MNYIWCAMVIASLAFSAFNGTMEETVRALADGAGAGIKTVLSIAGIMCFWCGIMNIMEKSGAVNFIGKLVRPVITRLFPKVNNAAISNIIMNITANILGMGNAATPAGIKAMSELDKINPNPSVASRDMAMLVILNTTSFQLIPTTIMSMRAAAGGNPSSVIIPIWIASAAGILAAVMAVRLMYGRGGKSI